MAGRPAIMVTCPLCGEEMGVRKFRGHPSRCKKMKYNAKAKKKAVNGGKK